MSLREETQALCTCVVRRLWDARINAVSTPQHLFGIVSAYGIPDRYTCPAALASSSMQAITPGQLVAMVPLVALWFCVQPGS